MALGSLERQRIALTATTNEVVVALPVAQGSMVSKGEVLVQLDDTLQKAHVTKALAHVAQANANYEKLLKGAREEEIAAARAKVSGAKASFLRKKFKAKFCIECLKDSLSKYGYGYFKSSWYYDIVCGVHHTPLFIMNTSNRIENNGAFRQIIRGYLPPNHAVAEAKHKEMNLYSDDIFHSYTTPCLLELATAKLRFFVADYFRADQSLFDAILNSIMTRLEKRLLYSTGEPKKAKFRDVAEGFRQLQEKEYAPVIAFLNDSVEITQGIMGIKSFGSMRFPALTSTDRDCKKCTVSNKHCALSPVIGIFLNPQRVDLSEGNYCDRVNAAYRRSDYRRVEFKVRSRTDFLDADRFTF
ncbi:hypothetical protein TUM4438_25690 [Shewanella sairae]|uniref:Biotin/lipoyl-binding protein n=2 Tax=Shewanella sairae TaxID=190310 RepID=A0ABQ4PI93_9GAMM|nr:hypothetical protein TUM4438_25690 [Shewanella sairae]